MRKKFIALIILGIVIGVYTISNIPLNSLDTWCESKGGKWSEQSKFCAIGMDGFSCTVSGGKYNDCDSHYVDEGGNVVISTNTACIKTCQFT